jgi:hypothetical protein
VQSSKITDNCDDKETLGEVIHPAKIKQQKAFVYYDFQANKMMSSGPLSGMTGLWQEDKLK